MPTPSHRRTRSRVEPQVSSPELPNKRRKMDPVSTLSQPLTDYQVNTIVSSLHAPSNDVVAAHDHANDKNARDHRDGVTAYAKICGRDWTYYVKDLKITLGRPPDSRPPGPPPAQSDVDIDLGPSKLVSRGHATIQYDSTEHRCWTIEVLGRNGIRVDDDQHKRGAIVQLRSGSMFEIAGVQMLFVLPDQSPTVVDSIFRRAHDPQAEYAGDGDSQETNLQSTQLSSETTFPNSQRKSHLPKSLPESQPQRTHPMQEVAASDLSMTSYSAPNERPSAPVVTPQRNSHASPGYHRGLMLESTEDIDYSLDSSKEIKPPYSYANLIAQAILSTDDQKLTLAHIYAWIQTNYAFYRFAASGWQNSIRHNLSLNKAFQKVPRRTDEPGKGMKWQIAPDYLEEYTKKIKKTPQTKQNRLLSPRVSSPITNSTKRSSMNVQKITSATGHTSPRRSATPPTAFGVGVVTPKEAFTPDRGSRASMKTKQTGQSGQNQPLSPTRPGGRASSPFIDEYSNSGTAITPAPQKHNPHLAPPSVNQLPSSYLPTSSPAPFWKYVNFLTPGRPDFSSPIKSPQLRSSSPPAPVRQISNRLREAGSPIKDKDNIFRGNHESTRLDPPAVPTTSADDDMGDNDTDDLAGIDLSRGFQKIGKFHAQHAIARSSQMKPRGTQAAV